MDDLRWHWRNLRDGSALFGLRPLHWRLTWDFYADVLGGHLQIQVGPFLIAFSFDHGDPNTWFGMAEVDAERNAYNWEGRDDG